MARVSVLMSCHGTGRWLPEALASIPWELEPEVIVTANGLNDAEDVFTACQGHAVRTIYRDATLPLSDSLNVMLALAAGDYVMRLDPDDKLPDGALAEMVDAAESVAPPCFAYGGYVDFGGAARVIPARPATLDELHDRPLGGYNVLVDTALARAIGGWEEIGYEDWHYYIKLMRYPGVTAVRLDRPTLLHRVRPGSRYATMVRENSRHLAALREALR